MFFRRIVHQQHISSSNYIEWLHRKPLHEGNPIDVFSDPVPTEVDGMFHYQPGNNPYEKILLSILEDVQKPSHNKCSSDQLHKQWRTLDL